MFTYCLNSPVNNVDSTGMRPVDVNLANHLSEYGGSKSVPVGTPITGEDIIGVVKDVFDAFGRFIDFITNDDERTALEAKYVAFYNGRLVIHLPWEMDPFSFGAIFLGKDAETWTNGVQELRHEYGHCVHFSQIGPMNYFLVVAIPSLIGHSFVETKDYYSQPWEYVGEILGNVTNRTYQGQPYQYSENASLYAVLYWLYTRSLP